MLTQDVSPKYVSIMKALYSHSTGRVRAYSQFREWFRTSSGVCQRCSIGLFLLSFVKDNQSLRLDFWMDMTSPNPNTYLVWLTNAISNDLSVSTLWPISIRSGGGMSDGLRLLLQPLWKEMVNCWMHPCEFLYPAQQTRTFRLFSLR